MPIKALILAAGFGTRLLPYTNRLPKPLFTLNRTTVLEHHIRNLVSVGCSQIIINTHHLHSQIECAVQDLPHREKIVLIHEPRILDTGGAILNACTYLKDTAFFVVNADVYCRIDFLKLMKAHQQTSALGTLVLCDDSRFNKVGVTKDGWVKDFNSTDDSMTFTGIQILSPEIFDYFPDKKIFSSVEVYRELSKQNKIKAYMDPELFWSDIGTPEAYQETSIRLLCRRYFKLQLKQIKDIRISHLAGDGSDRKWYRARFKNRSVVISDHGICLTDTANRAQLNSFIKIGRHLKQSLLSVPEIYLYDKISGIVLVEDLGDTHLQFVVEKSPEFDEIQKLYQKIIDQLIDFSKKGIQGFNSAWTCQTKTYSKEMILQYECRYFIEAFVTRYLKMDISFDTYLPEFEAIAEKAINSDQIGLMHRDFQSRNIMVHNAGIYFIDFQSARQGPIQYDLASLLIDQYVKLPKTVRHKLLEYTIEKLELDPEEQNKFKESYKFCCLTRNLQFLGAFAFLSQVKGKKQFERFIPDAVNSLNDLIQNIEHKKISRLKGLVGKIKGVLKNGSHLCDG